MNAPRSLSPAHTTTFVLGNPFAHEQPFRLQVCLDSARRRLDIVLAGVRQGDGFGEGRGCEEGLRLDRLPRLIDSNEAAVLKSDGLTPLAITLAHRVTITG